MNKRIKSLLLCFVMIFSLLFTALPAFAVPGKTTTLTVTPDKATASPGETVTYTVTLGAVEDLLGIKFKLIIPEGLTFVTGAAKTGVKEALGATSAEFTPSTKVFLADPEYTSASDLDLMTFECTVDSSASGNLTVQLYIDDPENYYDSDGDNIDVQVTNATITVTAAPNPATGISLNKTATTIYTGANETLIATVEPNDTTDTVTWTSSNTAVATVDNTGKVTAVAPGTATITAKAGDKTATCTVTVENAPCTHTSKTPVPAKASTCEEKGWDAYSKCNDCGQLFDNAGNKIDAIPYLPLAAHSLTPVAAKPATCTADGSKAYYVCSGCSKWFEDATGSVEITDHSSVVLTALGHDYTERIEDAAHKKASATDCRSHDTYWYDCTRGDHNAKDDPAASDKWYESTNAGPHSYDESAWGYKGADGHAHKCRYDDTHDTPVAHTPGAAATETTPQTCTECGYVITPALGHTHNMTPVAAKPATCTADGSKAYYVCSGCSKWFEDATGSVEITDHSSVVIGHLGHDFAPATCTTPKTCKRDGCDATEGIALGHDWKDATCTAPKTCQRDGCGATEGEPNGHTEGAEWKNDANYHWHICSVDGCGAVIESSKAAHTPDREAATETEPVKCAVCDYEIAPALGMQDYILEMPVFVSVKLTGDEKPGKETFKLEIYDCGVEDAEFEILNDVLTAEDLEFVDGGAYFYGVLKIKVTGQEQLFNLTEGFKVRMVKGTAKGWTYASEQWYVMPIISEGTTDAAFYFGYDVREIVDGEISEIPANGMSFTLGYEAVTEPGTPQTGDNSVMGLWIALLVVSGAGATAIYSRKRKSSAE